MSEEEVNIQNKVLIQMVGEEAEQRHVEKENRIVALRMQEFIRKKAKKDEAIKEERRLAKAAEEKETEKLLAMQEKQADLQVPRDDNRSNTRKIQKLTIKQIISYKWLKKKTQIFSKMEKNKISLWKLKRTKRK